LSTGPSDAWSELNESPALLAVLRSPVVRDGQWQLLECARALEDN
jgi:hypothetical protein